jgi:ABC-type antimicrobial peptide transport system permease subunit
VINEALAETFWPGEEAVGQLLRLDEEGLPAQVIGVVATSRYRTLGEAPRPYLYLNLLQNPETSQVLIARTGGDAAALATTLRNIARSADRRVPILQARSFEEAMGTALLLPRMGASVFGLFGVLGTLLAAVGLYGVMAYLVSRRTREMGIRLALGAEQSQVLALVLRQGLTRTLAGIGLGLVAAVGLTRALAAILYGVSPTDPATFLGVSLTLVFVATIASWLPARRAASVSPSVALRYE